MKKTLVGFLIAAVCTVNTLLTVFAAGNVSVNADKDTAAVGDTYTVSVKIEGAEGAAVAPDVSVNYDVNRLEFVSCTGEYGGGAGGYITIESDSADVTFNILSGGQADVDVTAIFDGDAANEQIVTASVMVDGEDTAAVNELARDESFTGIEAGSVATPDGKIVSAVFADEFMPIGFYKTTVSYEEQMVEAAQFDMGGIVLLYVTDADGNNGNFDIYDQSTGELSDFLQISGIENRFIIALRAGEDVEVPDNFTKAELQWNAQNLEAYAYTGNAISDSQINVSDFFLLYAISSEGNKGWYMYDQTEGTYQRYVPGLHGGKTSADEGILSQITSPVSSDDSEGGVNIVLIIAIALAVLLIALIVTVIIMAVKLHEYNSYDYIDEDEDYEDGEEEGNNYLENLAKAKEEPVPQGDIPEEFVVRKKNKPEDEERHIQDIDLRDAKSHNDNIEPDMNDAFSPRSRQDSLEEDYGYMTEREQKKAMKQAEKARKKEEKRMRKEYGEYGPVDWDSWQSGIEGGAKTAAAHMNGGAASVDENAVRRKPQEMYEESEVRIPEERYEEPAKRMPKARDEEPVRRAKEERYEEPVTRGSKGNPMDMMRSIPANDNKAPVQAKPVQQFDFDDDFEFEFLKLDDED